MVAKDDEKRSGDISKSTDIEALVSSLARLTRELENQNLLLMQLVASNQQMLEELIGDEGCAALGVDLSGKAVGIR